MRLFLAKTPGFYFPEFRGFAWRMLGRFAANKIFKHGGGIGIGRFAWENNFIRHLSSAFNTAKFSMKLHKGLLYPSVWFFCGFRLFRICFKQCLRALVNEKRCFDFLQNRKLFKFLRSMWSVTCIFVFEFWQSPKAPTDDTGKFLMLEIARFDKIYDCCTFPLISISY